MLQDAEFMKQNWMHQLFIRMQANKAVTKNGSVMGGSIMIGITHCTDQSVLDNGQTSVLETSVNPGVANLSSTLGGTPRSIRPLTQVKLSKIESSVKILQNMFVHVLANSQKHQFSISNINLNIL